jgi:hypothetical protein
MVTFTTNAESEVRVISLTERDGSVSVRVNGLTVLLFNGSEGTLVIDDVNLRQMEIPWRHATE